MGQIQIQAKQMNAQAAQPPTAGGTSINLFEIAERLGQYFIENIDAISIVVVVLIGALVYQQIMNMQQNENKMDGGGGGGVKKSQTVIVETFDNADSAAANDAMDSLDAKLKAGFCKTNLGKPAELERSAASWARTLARPRHAACGPKWTPRNPACPETSTGPFLKTHQMGPPKRWIIITLKINAAGIARIMNNEQM